MLTPEKKQAHLATSRDNLSLYNADPAQFLRKYVTMDETDASEQTATLSSSHEIGGGSAGARSGYRPYPKTARDKFYVASSDSRDQAQMASEP